MSSLTKLSLFPHVVPDEVTRARTRRALAMGALHRAVIAVLDQHGELSDTEIYERLDAKYRMGVIEAATDALARAGKIADTGERGAWTPRGRAIVWRLA